MTESRWAHWSPGTLKTGLRTIGQFMEQAPMQAGMGTRSAADEAAAKGLTHAGYGYWKDSSGQVVAQTRDGVLVMIDQTDKMQPSQVDMGNPTGEASGQTPADKARSMGLISDGSGSYKDSQGNTIARTVNNELVFYDSRAGGGAVSDGSGGAQITQSSPSWVDPVTGLIVVPPAQPESPEEINAVPDPTPATAPAGYDAFVNKRKKEMYADHARETEIEQDIAQQQSKNDAIINSSGTMMDFKQLIDSKIEKASGGSENAQDLAQRAQRIIEDEEVLTEFQEIADAVNDPSTVAPLLARRVIQLARKEKFEEVLNDMKQEYQDDTRQVYQAIELEHPGLWDAALNTEFEDELKTLGFDYKTKEQKEMEAEAQFDSEMGIDGARESKPQQTISGDSVTYTLEFPGTSEDNEKIQKKVLRVAAKAGKKFNQKPSDIVSITWDTNKEEVEDPAEKRRTALDALKTWRNNVLPTLEPGTVVHNDPQMGGRGDNVRERIYQLAGFGDYNIENEGQYGLIVNNNGKNEVVPVDFSAPKKSRSKKLKEGVMRYLDYMITEDQVNRMYEALFE